MNIDIDKHLTESEKKEIAIQVFKENIEKAFGGSQFTDSGKERDRVIKNSVAKWISDYVESLLTEEDKLMIIDKTREAISSSNYSFYVFQKPDVWDRTEYTAYKVITDEVKNNTDFIQNKVKEAIIKQFSLQNGEEYTV